MSVLVLVMLTCVLFNLPTFWMFKVEVMHSPNETTLYLLDLGHFSHQTPNGQAFLWLRTALGIFAPLCLLVFFNSRLIVALQHSDKFRRVTSSQSCSAPLARRRYACSGGGKSHVSSSPFDKREESLRSHNRLSQPSPRSAKSGLTTVLVFIIIFFVLLVFPSEIMDFVSHLTGLISPDPEAFMVARIITNILQVSNFSFNFLLYFALNARFRSTVTQLFCHCWHGRVERRGVVGGYTSCQLNTMAEASRNLINEKEASIISIYCEPQRVRNPLTRATLVRFTMNNVEYPEPVNSCVHGSIYNE